MSTQQKPITSFFAGVTSAGGGGGGGASSNNGGSASTSAGKKRAAAATIESTVKSAAATTENGEDLKEANGALADDGKSSLEKENTSNSPSKKVTVTSSSSSSSSPATASKDVTNKTSDEMKNKRARIISEDDEEEGESMAVDDVKKEEPSKAKPSPAASSFFKARDSKKKNDGSPATAANTPTSAISSPSSKDLSVVKKEDEKKDESTTSLNYGMLCDTFDKIEGTTKRLEIAKFLTEFFGMVIDNYTPNCLLESVYLCLNRICPDYEGKEFGVGESLLVKAIAAATGRKAQAIKADVETKGDLGLVAQSSKGKQKQIMFGKPKIHTVHTIFEALKAISNMSGNQSQARKVEMISGLLTNSKGSEPKYLIRSLEGKLRIGLAQQTILVALAHAAAMREDGYAETKNKKSYLDDAVVVVKQVFSEIPSYDKIIPVLLEHGHAKLPDFCQLSPGIPLKPMLAHPTKSLTDVLNRFEGMAFTCEYKYDGERAQIHLMEDGKVMVYSRNSENLSEKYPDIIARMPNCVKPETKSFVLDCEAVAWDVKQKCILPFQVLSTRKRKDVQASDIQVQVCIYAFDILYLNGEALVKKNLKERRALLHGAFKEVEGEFEYAKNMDSTSVEDIQTFLDASIVGNCEGLMVKTLEEEATYEPSKRSRNWLKVKKDYVNGLGDSLDLVVIGGYLGRGKRTGHYGGYLLACYDEDGDYQSICKIGTGFSDEALQQQFTYLKEHIIASPPAYYKVSDNPNIKPDVWFEPAIVWEVKAADLSISPVHKAASGLVDPVKGISLRFPRYIRLRDDKKAEEATSSEQVKEFYLSQASVNNKAADGENADDDFEY